MTDSSSEMLAKLAGRNIDAPSGGMIEMFLDKYPVSPESVPVFERFLGSTNSDNRSAALMALTQYGKRIGYEADAIALHYQTRTGFGSPEEFAALGYLREMSLSGSAVAKRLLILLDRDPYIAKLYSELDPKYKTKT